MAVTVRADVERPGVLPPRCEVSGTISDAGLSPKSLTAGAHVEVPQPLSTHLPRQHGRPVNFAHHPLVAASQSDAVRYAK